jgi:Ca2+-binding EF-hand superfamily protein
LIGTFLSESDVGFGTIVGSAVFNVLFVIGMCAVFSKELLKLTWWPLFRDSVYYIISLGLLALFFGGPTKESKFIIEFWEALILFLAYIGYVIVMKFNVQLQKKITRCFNKFLKKDLTAGSSDIHDEKSAAYVDGSSKEGGDTENPNDTKKGDLKILPSNPLLRPANFRVGLLQMVLTEQDPEEQIRVKVVAQIVGDVHQTFSAIDSNGTDTIDKEEFRELIRQLSGGGLSTDDIKKTADDVFATIDLDGNKQVSFKEFQHWYLKSETRVMNDVKKAFDEIDVTEDGFVKKENFTKVVDELGMSQYMNDEAKTQAMHMFSEGQESKEGFINFEQFCAWYRGSMLWDRHTHKNEEEAAAEEESEGLDLSWPTTGRARITYIIWAPIIIPLALTIFDCRKPKYVK